MRTAQPRHDRGAICPFPARVTDCEPCGTPAKPRQHRCAVATLGRAMVSHSATGATAVDETPDWWPYAPEFPHWHVWRGVAGLLYARRPRSSPPKVVRGKDLTTLRERIINAEAIR